MRYKVGDKVRVRKDLEVGKDYGRRAVAPEMTNLAGMIATIKSVGRDYYELEEDIDLFDWTDEMIEGLAEENKPKLKLIDILNKIANGELKEGAKVIYKNNVFDWDGNVLIDGKNKTFFGTIKSELNEEVELIEPNQFREDTKMIEPTDNTTEKIEELDEKYIPWLDLVKDINKIIRKLNAHSIVLLAQEKDINEIKEQLEY